MLKFYTSFIEVLYIEWLYDLYYDIENVLHGSNGAGLPSDHFVNFCFFLNKF